MSFGKRVRENFAIEARSFPDTDLITKPLIINGKLVNALVDSGASMTIIKGSPMRFDREITLMDGSNVKAEEVSLEIELSQVSVKVKGLLVDKLLSKFDAILGMDAIRGLGGVTINETATFGCESINCNAVDNTHLLSIDELNFQIKFDGKWRLKWKWANGEEPKFDHSCSYYNVKNYVKENFERVLEQ